MLQLIKQSIDAKFIALFISVMFLTGCSDENLNSNDGQLKISVSSNANQVGRTASNKVENMTINISEFKMNLKEFELELEDGFEDDDWENDDEAWNDDGMFDYEDEIEFEGPFELDLMSGQVTFISTVVPNGTYEELEFKFHKGTDASSELFGKTVLVRGTIDNVPFLFWDDFWDEIEIDYNNPQIDITIENDINSIVIFFDLSAVINSTGGVDLSQAQDGNQDGLIEIYHNDPDGNSNLAQQLRNAIRNHIDLIDD